MNAKEKEAFIKTISSSENYTSDLSYANRVWFSTKVFDFYNKPPISDSALKTKVKAEIKKSTSLASQKRNKLKIGVSLSDKLVRNNQKRRAQIIYGTLGLNPEFIDGSNPDYLDFIIKRRYRAVIRMAYFVNPNSKGYFRYPNKCKDKRIRKQFYRVNESARAHWNVDSSFVQVTHEGKQIPADYIPLKKDAADFASANFIDTAIGKLFIKKSSACKGTLLECARVMSVVLMDALRESKNPTQLLRSQIALKPADDHFLSIYPVTLFTGYADSTDSKALFKREPVDVEDLVIGDQVYVFNHPLYKVFNPTGSWRGEHSLIQNLGNRDHKSSKGYKFAGHGKSTNTLFNWYNSFLKELKTNIYRTYRISKIHLNHLKNINAPLPPGITVTTFPDVDLAINLGTGNATEKFIIREYSGKFSYKDFEKGKDVDERDFLVIHARDHGIFFIDDKKKKADFTSNNNEPTKPIFVGFDGNNNPAEAFDPVNWAIRYADSSAGVIKRFFFAERINGKLRVKLLKIKDLFDSPFSLLDRKKGKLNCNRPKVDLSSTYKSYLTSNGAF